LIADSPELSNDILKSVIKQLNYKVTHNMEIEVVQSHLFSNLIITDDLNEELHCCNNRSERRNKLISNLHLAGHPRAFIELRLALVESGKLSEWLVNEIDKLYRQKESMQINDHAEKQGKFHRCSVRSYSL